MYWCRSRPGCWFTRTPAGELVFARREGDAWVPSGDSWRGAPCATLTQAKRECERRAGPCDGDGSCNPASVIVPGQRIAYDPMGNPGSQADHGLRHMTHHSQDHTPAMAGNRASS